MSHTFMIADTHFDSSRLIRYENRPFSDAAAMNKEMIRLWNETVAPDDTVYHLGDFGADGHEQDILSRLNGTIMLIRGNHDVRSNAYYRGCGFAEVYDMPVIRQNFWILSHEPMYISDNVPYANIFGHVHASPLYRTFSSHHYCVSAERIGYRPIDAEEIIRRVQEADPE